MNGSYLVVLVDIPEGDWMRLTMDTLIEVPGCKQRLILMSASMNSSSCTPPVARMHPSSGPDVNNAAPRQDHGLDLRHIVII